MINRRVSFKNLLLMLIGNVSNLGINGLRENSDNSGYHSLNTFAKFSWQTSN